jgi:hypothetical protein
LKKLLNTHGKGFLQPLPVFSLRYRLKKAGRGVGATAIETTFIIELLEIFQP